jgi:L-ascorbate metabolism protein UlaG (beta-lactamase superfamily)
MSGRRWGRRIAGAAVLAGAGAAAVWALRDIPAQFGAQRTVTRGDRVRSSSRFRDGRFHNTDPVAMAVSPSSGVSLLREAIFGTQQRRPTGTVPLATPAGPAGADELHVTWYGHASALVEIDGARVLLDPVWSERCSPSRLAGPRRLHPTPVALADLPRLDAVLISHDHYDHLDLATVQELTRTQSAPFLVPLGVGAHLSAWGVPAGRIVELDWDESHAVAGLTLTATAAQHFSGRAFTRDNTLWASWVIAGGAHRVFYTGDSGYFDGYAGIGAAYGPFDATLVQVGAYGVGWPHIHMFPEEAVQAHLDVRGDLLVPVHWCTFNLAFHDWAEPIERLWREAKARGVRLAVPRPGQTVDVAEPPAVDDWWQPIA